jgi:hypothetical protein
MVFVETLIVNLIGEVEKRPTLYKKKHLMYSFENSRSIAYRICVLIDHQLDYLVETVCALAAQPGPKSAD